jgi:hypothetical protein
MASAVLNICAVSQLALLTSVTRITIAGAVVRFGSTSIATVVAVTSITRCWRGGGSGGGGGGGGGGLTTVVTLVIIITGASAVASHTTDPDSVATAVLVVCAHIELIVACFKEIHLPLASRVRPLGAVVELILTLSSTFLLALFFVNRHFHPDTDQVVLFPQGVFARQRLTRGARPLSSLDLILCT